MNGLTPQHVLADLLGSGDFPAEVIDPEAAAEIIIQRLLDAGFEIVSAERPGRPHLPPRGPERAPATFLESWKGRRFNHACLTSAGANRLEASGQDPWTSSDLYARHGS
jgi:hypothetical protein